MRKISLLLCLIVLCFCMVACGNTSESDFTSVYDDNKTLELKKEIMSSISSEIPVSSVDIRDHNDLISVTVTLSGNSSVSDFGKNVYQIVKGIHESFDSISICVILPIQNDFENSLVFNTVGKSYYGSVVDFRSGSPETTLYDDLNDFSEDFPALKTFLMEEKIEPAKLDIYTDVINYLDKYPSTPEDILLKEIAPQYNMEWYELRQFVHDIEMNMEVGPWEDLYIEADYETYNSPASENGLDYTFLKLTGTIDSKLGDYCYSFFDDLGNNWVLAFPDEINVPTISQEITAYITYVGVSDKYYDLPCGFLLRYEQDGSVYCTYENNKAICNDYEYHSQTYLQQKFK
ncbi:MAG: hypothetical protein PUI40_10470 [Oscillospiraceae bacterium]|nr:hypothetical protein [Oscillospiraceae bacterium]MDD7042360.1 hypothetical protein [Oscillospiraceae bacterium]MDY2610494.1 hypothetical protein [Oscillospiraceae bacterium]